LTYYLNHLCDAQFVSLLLNDFPAFATTFESQLMLWMYLLFCLCGDVLWWQHFFASSYQHKAFWIFCTFQYICTLIMSNIIFSHHCHYCHGLIASKMQHFTTRFSNRIVQTQMFFEHPTLKIVLSCLKYDTSQLVCNRWKKFISLFPEYFILVWQLTKT